MNDLRFAWRQLLKQPAFTAVAVITLALGIGANTAIFSIVKTVVLQPLPYPEPEGLVTLWERNPRRGMEQERVSPPNFAEWSAGQQSFTGLAYWSGEGEANLIVGDQGVEKVRRVHVSANLFALLGVPPIMGRSLLPEEDQPDGPRVALISHELWQRRFSADPNVLGQAITLDTYGRRDYQIVGVMPPGFDYPARSDLWLPAGWNGLPRDRRGGHWLEVVGRLKPGVAREQARTDLSAIQARAAQDHPEAIIGSEVAIIPLLDHTLGRTLRPALAALWGVVAGVLLIACANVANLLRARAATRRKEIALRLTLGASRGRIVRQLLVESLLLGGLGGALGTLLAAWTLDLIVATGAGQIPRLAEARIDAGALLFTLGLSLVTGALFGLAPAWQFTRANQIETLKDGGRGVTSSRAEGWLRDLLVAGEVALALMLLIAAGLMTRSFTRLAWLDRGFQPEQLLAVELDYSVSGFTTWARATPTRPQISLQALLERVRGEPGVQSAAVTHALPRRTAGPPVQPILIQGRALGDTEDPPRTHVGAVSPGYFQTMGTPLLRGRDFTEADHLGAPKVVIINETLARQLFPGQNPVGQRIAYTDRNNPRQPAQPAPWETQGPWGEIVGVVADIKSLSQRPEPTPEMYSPYWQWPMQNPVVVVRAQGHPSALAAAIRRDVKELIPALPAPAIKPMNEVIAETTAQPRWQAGLISLFGLVALALATVGVYGVLAYSVTRRTAEIGVRLALGARDRHVFALVIGQGLRLAVAGVLLGLLGAWAATRVLGALLFQTSPTDPLTFAAVPALLLLVALVACWLPARRAARIDPMVALRHD